MCSLAVENDGKHACKDPALLEKLGDTLRGIEPGRTMPTLNLLRLVSNLCENPPCRRALLSHVDAVRRFCEVWYTPTHTLTHTQARTHTHTHTHTLSLSLVLLTHSVSRISSVCSQGDDRRAQVAEDAVERITWEP